MTTVGAFVRGWFREPLPSFELRNASARWGLTRRGPAFRTLRVSEVIQETPSTRSFVLASSDGGPPALSYRAGQHLTLAVDIDGSTHRRCYSFSTSPLSDGLPAITVKRTASGVVSRYLHEHVRPGDELRVLDPTGEFTVETDPGQRRHLALIAGGVGITPLISIVETVLRTEPGSRITLLCGNRREEEILFRERLARLEVEFRPRLAVRHALDEAPEAWQDVRGALDGERVLQLLGEGPADGYFICGPEPMMQGICDALARAGIARERVHTERFAYAQPVALPLPDRESVVVFARSGRRTTTQPGQTLLQAGLEAGVLLPSSCTMGGCGACKVRRLEGSVVMSEPNCLSEAEREAGYVLACCCYPDGEVVIEGY
jgi:ring-1,2-phenylacetyl-CoA epoxidase subunit PaaE